MKTREDIEEILKDVKYKDWEFHLGDLGHGWFLQMRFWAADNNGACMAGGDAILMAQHGRKYYISPYMTKSEIVRSAFIAAKLAEEHEMYEQFTYKGLRIFTPHPDVDALVEYTKVTPEDSRPKQ